MRQPGTVAEVVQRASPRHISLAVAAVGTSPDVVHRGGAEVAPGRALWQVGSITKVFTALVLARSVVRGEVSLDTPVRRILGWAPADITLGQLATHTAGLPRIPPELWTRALRRDPDPYADLDGAALAASLERLRRRGVGRVRYSNLGFGLLGLALATAAGTTYDELVRAEVGDPLGLGDTSTSAAVERRLTGHTRRLRPRPTPWHFQDAMAGCGALWSSIEDMQAFVGAVLDPPPGELGEAMRLAARTHVSARGHDQGLGWIRFTRGPAAGHLFHNGGTYGFRSSLLADPSTRSGVVALTNVDRSVDGLVVSALGADGLPHPSVGGV
ncbi:hypothetical protein GCM10011376_40330 [Nocardioides flavus (ex Wang et al. 2016)]|uniref:Beta-lactamase-related domain-containing protein n=1 Tax=Nocardioides flavus (ex Wang et al. 2016) TaxID=2058780 RepID=A0ABQ3HP12_9ACTN|nr:serine hydrolase domain-containing protein [Nocardioides flavus (ex Wang et al. 2016)]GHE19423.1 hypothetical protein GCM10011376_40330 [Nocardioides flavus (ex Wang et al. 2016)]